MSVDLSTGAPPAITGKRVYFVGHSFHMFIVRPLIALAKEAGIKGHWAEGWDMIGGSTPMQHWERNGDDNEPRRALATGRVEVLTLASNVIVPEPAIDLFADLAILHNPDVKVMVQHSWGDTGTGMIMRARHAARLSGSTSTPGVLPPGVPSNEERDKATAADLAGQRAAGEAAKAALRAQLEAINQRHSGRYASLVPAGEAVLRAREAVVAGELPGVAKQSELFRDALGHAAQPVADLVTYLWFAALYGCDPRGSSVLVDHDIPEAEAQHAVLQRIALETLRDEPARP